MMFRVQPSSGRVSQFADGLCAIAPTILLVEEETALRRDTASTLRMIGYNVVEAASGPHALVALEQALVVDLLFTDLCLSGGMDGVQLADAVRAGRSNIPVLFVGTPEDDEDGAREAGLGRNATLLTRPHVPAEVIEKVALAMSSQGTRSLH